MKATVHNTRGTCERCLKQSSGVMAVAFQGDGTATLRFLCAGCEAREKGRNNPRLFGKDTPVLTFADPDEAIEAVTEPEPFYEESPQLSLWEPGELPRQPQDRGVPFFEAGKWERVAW